MNDRSVSIALYIEDRAAQQLTRIMFLSAGANVLLCDDASAIQAAAERVQAIVLGLTGSPEDTIAAVVMLRKQLTTMPIYALADAAGQRHSERVKTVGVTEVIPNAELQQRAAQLVSQLAESAQTENLAVLSPTLTQSAIEQGYDVESMDLETWLAIPGNRRLLGMPESSDQTDVPAKRPEQSDRRPGTEPSLAALDSPVQLATAGTAAHGMSSRHPPGRARGNGPDPRESPSESSCDFADFPQLIMCREEHAAQNNAILDAHKQREKRLQAAIKTELYRAMSERIAASEAKMLQGIDESVANVRCEIAVAIRRMNLMMGGLAGLIVIVAVLLV